MSHFEVEPDTWMLTVDADEWSMCVSADTWVMSVALNTDMLFSKVYQAPDAVRVYRVDWTKWLANVGNDTITESTWTADSGVTLSSATSTTLYAQTTVTGGVLGNTYNVTNHITTAGSLQQDYTFIVEVTRT